MFHMPFSFILESSLSSSKYASNPLCLHGKRKPEYTHQQLTSFYLFIYLFITQSVFNMSLMNLNKLIIKQWQKFPRYIFFSFNTGVNPFTNWEYSFTVWHSFIYQFRPNPELCGEEKLSIWIDSWKPQLLFLQMGWMDKD